MYARRRLASLALLTAFAAGCAGDPLTLPGQDPNGPGNPNDPGDPNRPNDPNVPNGENCQALRATIRDFDPATHPDFETFTNDWPTRGLVKEELGDDDLPVFASVGSPQQLTGAEWFYHWYRDTELNESFEIDLVLTEVAPGTFVYDNDSFFPIDGMGFGNSGRDLDGVSHNFHFTTEIHTSFKYRGGETFEFSGDDDLWIFVNGRLALDLGGLHPPRDGIIDFDAQAEELGLEIGGTYPMDVFHAERHTEASNFRIVTNIECFFIPTPI